MPKPTLLFCVGATKAGTSWLHRYISDHPECYMRGIKELHYFDAVEFDDWDPWLNMIEGRRAQSLRDAEALAPSANDARERKMRVVRDAEAWHAVLSHRRQNDTAYIDYLTSGMGNQRLVADFTPAYSLLPEARLRQMFEMSDDVRFVYLLRDPVDRVWSHCRMMARRRANKPEEIPKRSVNIMKRVLKGKEPEIVRRSDYAATLEKLKNAVPGDRLHLAFYEELFTSEAVGALSKFLGISHAWADFDKRFMEGPGATMEPGQWSKMREFLADQYDASRALLPRVPGAWDVNPDTV